MKLKQQALTIAIILMSLGLFLGGFYVVHAEDEQPTTETQEVTEEEKEKEQGGDTKTIEETKQKVEEINTKIDKVDNQIAQQMIDKETLKEQAGEIESIKKEITTIKAAIPDVPTGPNQTINIPYDVNKIIPLRKSKEVYVYRLTLGPTSATGTTNRVYIFASNSPDLSLGKAYSNSGQTLNYIALKNIYTENNGELKQPICGCQISSTMTEANAIELVTNSNNWGYTDLVEPPAVPSGSVTVYWGYQLCQMRNTGEYMGSGSDILLVPYGEQNEAPEQEGPEYFTAIGQYRPSDGIFARINAPASAAESGFVVEPTLEIIRTIEPQIQEWTTEQLYMPILVIMSVLIIILFKKR